MASIVGKKQGNKTYYYLVESARVDGKPRIVSQQYLGSADEIAERLAGVGPGEPARVQQRSFGAVAAVWSMITRLDVVGIVDDVAGERRADAAASVGTYTALAVVNRVVAPCSKLALGDWWETTVGPRLVRQPKGATDHRRFWEAMDTLSEDDIAQIEDRVTAAMVEVFDLDLSALVLDMTNFATFIDSANARNTIAQRGHAKQKRVDLRLVGLAMVVTRDGGVPIYSHAYEGNRPDVTQFGAAVTALADRWSDHNADGEGVTVVFDAGCDSAANVDLVEGLGVGYVGSLVVTNHQNLLAVPASKFGPVDGLDGLSFYETTTHALGGPRRVIVTHSDTFHQAQLAGFEQSLAKARRRLAELAARLARGNTRRDRPAVEADIAAICANDRVNQVIDWTLTGTNPDAFKLRWRTNTGARRRLERHIFGKRILFTDRHWPVAEVVAAYRSQADVEAGFRQLKDRRVIAFNPMFHWTDQKIRVHAFHCVTALAVAHLMRREAHQGGIDLSVRELLRHLGGIAEITLLYPGDRGRPRARRHLTDMTPTQQRLYDLFSLDSYAPTR
jgi:transposase